MPVDDILKKLKPMNRNVLALKIYAAFCLIVTDIDVVGHGIIMFK